MRNLKRHGHGEKDLITDTPRCRTRRMQRGWQNIFLHRAVSLEIYQAGNQDGSLGVRSKYNHSLSVSLTARSHYHMRHRPPCTFVLGCLTAVNATSVDMCLHAFKLEIKEQKHDRGPRGMRERRKTTKHICENQHHQDYMMRRCLE